MKEDDVMCVCCTLKAILVFQEKTALCLIHSRFYQRILQHESATIHIEVIDDE